MALSEMEHEIFAIFALAAFVFLMEKSGAFNIFADPLALLKWSVLYFVIGVVWSFVKWASFVYKKADDFVKARVYFLSSLTRDIDVDELGLTKITEKTKVPEKFNKVFIDYLRGQNVITYAQHEKGNIQPSALENKSKITTWIIWWPTSALWTVMSDPMVRIANWIFGRLKGTYQLISARAFAKFE